ncbi:GNAT family N-acetyltransferase [Sphingobium lactosutens]|uniref:GNAT family N-acetyltransferase n=1 Tax=Sphingobium lactosutens TaxID=522773 RepID=UPI0015BA54C2|nr:GNAT family N-acetyltransferase [Sphingobium lactosutens]NWK96236.1 GNAT family N-acetyltransferase [Sphingobium lactosutens]
MDAILIRRFAPADTQAVIDVILPIQRDEYGIAITAQDQPDLSDIPDFYQSGAGDFLVAEAEGRIIGTIGMKDIGGGRVALRKMFVSAAWRGRDQGVAQALLAALLDLARERGVAEIWLGATARFLAAHRFYERNGFMLIEADRLPASFPRMAVDSRFYHLKLRAER